MDQRYASIVLLLHPSRGKPRTLYVRRWVLWAALAVLLVGVPIGIWGALELGRIQENGDARALQARADKLEEENATLEAQVEDLRARIGELQSAKSMQAGKMRKFQEMADKLQDRIHGLEDQVSFYRNILDPQKADRDASVEDLRVRSLEGPDRSYHYTFKLVQGIAKKESVQGFARVAVTFENKEGEEKVRFFPDGSRYRRKGMEADFRYFQEFDGRLKLPPEVDPLRVTVQLYEREGLGELLSQRYEWGSLVQPRKESRNAQEKG